LSPPLKVVCFKANDYNGFKSPTTLSIMDNNGREYTSEETGDRSQESGVRSQKTGDRIQETDPDAAKAAPS